jgi:hypothetical protein
MKTITVPFNKYGKREYKKNQIFLHHTVSPSRYYNRGGHKGDVKYWNSIPYYIGTYVLIDSDGTKYQLFDSNKWANHLGLRKADYEKFNISYRKLDHTSIGIELDNFGPLIYVDKKFKPKAYPDSEWVIPEKKVIIYDKPFRGNRIYERYSEEQMDALRDELLKLTDIYPIPLHYNENMFEVNEEALRGVPGIWSHTSVRLDKSDVHPQPELIEMLKSLKKKPIEIPPIPIVYTDEYFKHKDLANLISQVGWNKNIK